MHARAHAPRLPVPLTRRAPTPPQRIAAVVALKEGQQQQQQHGEEQAGGGGGGGLTLRALRDWAAEELPKYQVRHWVGGGGGEGLGGWVGGQAPSCRPR